MLNKIHRIWIRCHIGPASSQINSGGNQELVCRFFGERLTAPMHRILGAHELAFTEHLLLGTHIGKEWGYEDKPDLQVIRGLNDYLHVTLEIECQAT